SPAGGAGDGMSTRYGATRAGIDMEGLDAAMRGPKEALPVGSGGPPSRVSQSSSEPIQFDETGALCGSQPTLGMDVHPGLKLNKPRLQETADFLHDFLGRLECIASTAGHSCPAGLATGTGTGFNLVTDHIPEFAERGLCARDPKRAFSDGVNMRVPRKVNDEWKPYSPAGTTPYAHHWRLFRTPNDAFLMANTHKENLLLFDILQPAW